MMQNNSNTIKDSNDDITDELNCENVMNIATTTLTEHYEYTHNDDNHSIIKESSVNHESLRVPNEIKNEIPMISIKCNSTGRKRWEECDIFGITSVGEYNSSFTLTIVNCLLR